MNKARRKEIARARDLLGEARTILEVARDEERDYFDNMPESIQEGAKGEKAEAVAETLEEAIDDLESLDEKLEEAAA